MPEVNSVNFRKECVTLCQPYIYSQKELCKMHLVKKSKNPTEKMAHLEHQIEKADLDLDMKILKQELEVDALPEIICDNYI